MCLYPKTIKNRKYTVTKKNGGDVPKPRNEDKRLLTLEVGCGHCSECLQKKARDWQARLLEDIKDNRNGKFVTLTFSDESIKKMVERIRETQKVMPVGYDLDNEIAIQAVKLFRERFRFKYKKSPRHWLVTELGGNGTENIHLHGIIWTDESLQEIDKLWGYGYTDNIKRDNYVNEGTIGYITKYVSKMDEKHKYYKSVVLTSPGIGNRYTKNNYDSTRNKFNENGKTNEAYQTKAGHKIALPQYWRNKIYTEDQREELRIQKLNSGIAYIKGEKVDISKNWDEYHSLQKWYQERDKKLGYRGITNNQEQEQQERERRIHLQRTRIARAHAREEDKERKRQKKLANAK